MSKSMVLGPRNRSENHQRRPHTFTLDAVARIYCRDELRQNYLVGREKYTLPPLATRRLLDRLDDADGDSPMHIAYGETSKCGVLLERFNAERPGRYHFDDSSITRLDELRNSSLVLPVRRLIFSRISLNLHPS